MGSDTNDSYRWAWHAGVVIRPPPPRRPGASEYDPPAVQQYPQPPLKDSPVACEDPPGWPTGPAEDPPGWPTGPAEDPPGRPTAHPQEPAADPWSISRLPTPPAPQGVNVPDWFKKPQDVIHERATTYGKFKDVAAIVQSLKAVLRGTPNWDKLKPSQREALEMVVHKMARILNGDPNYKDSWVDIAGYAELIVKELEGNPV